MSERRQSSGELVTIFGGSGFVGRQVVRALAKRGYRIRAAVRRPDLAGDIMPLGGVGQVTAVQANVRYRPSVERAVAGAHVVINLVGILKEGAVQRVAAVHSYRAPAAAAAVPDAGARRCIQMSSLGADPHSSSAYARTKAEAEAAALGAGIEAVVFRPSVIFGSEDQLFNRFAA